MACNKKIHCITENIYLGDSSHSEDELLKLEITHIFNISPITYRKYDKIIETKYELEDSKDQNIIDIFPIIISKLKELVDKNYKIYIHCYAGVSRSPSVVIYYLMKYNHMNYGQAYEFVKNIRYIIEPNANFIKQLKMLDIV